MKKLSVFIALCIILSSCTKTVDQVVKIIKEDVSVHGKKYKVPVQIDLSCQRLDVSMKIRKGTTVLDGEYSFEEAVGLLGEEKLKTGGSVDVTLNQWDGNDPNEERTLLGSAVVHLKLNKGDNTKEANTGTGTWTFGKIEGTMTKYLSEGAGVLTFKHDRDLNNGDEEFRYPTETFVLKGLMKK